jgi:hypothetical protein
MDSGHGDDGFRWRATHLTYYAESFNIHRLALNEIQQQTYQSLQQAAAAVRVGGLGSKLSDALLALAGAEGSRLQEPCVVAVVGRVKAGKSTETTATINYFRYGRPADPGQPVTVHYRNGRSEPASLALLQGLQGNDEATLRQATEIERLEYRLEVEFLRQVTLVDTPGTGAVVQTHQQRTADFLRLNRVLREQHDQQTRALGESADAVIYLVGQVPRADDRALLDAFRETTGTKARAANAIGVMAKIDLDPEILSRAGELAAKTAAQLPDQLNTVVPVSAALERALDRLQADQDAGLRRLRQSLLAIPPQRLHKLLDNEEFFSEYEFADCPVDCAERRALQGTLDWMTFVTLARELADPATALSQAKAALRAKAGFAPLRRILERHLFARSQMLRCFRILADARTLVRQTRLHDLPRLRDRVREHAGRQARFIDFVQGAQGDPATARELIEWIERIAVAPAEPVAAALDQAERILGGSYHRLEAHAEDFRAQQDLEMHREQFGDQDYEELRRLMGHYGLDPSTRLAEEHVGDLGHVFARQQYWHSLAQNARNPVRRQLAERASIRLGLIADDWDMGEA